MSENARPTFPPSPRGTGSIAEVQHLSQMITDKSADLLHCTISGCFDSETLIHTEHFESQASENAGTAISHYPHGAEKNADTHGDRSMNMIMQIQQIRKAIYRKMTILICIEACT